MSYGSLQELGAVARKCPGYDPIQKGPVSSGSGASCLNCENYQDRQCVKDLYDKVLVQGKDWQ